MAYAETSFTEYADSQGLPKYYRVDKVLVTGTAPQIARRRHLPFLRLALDVLRLTKSTTITKSAHTYFCNAYNLTVERGGSDPTRILWVTEMGTAHLSGHLAHARRLGAGAAVLVGIAGSLNPDLQAGRLFSPTVSEGNDSAAVNRPYSNNKFFRPYLPLQNSLDRRLQAFSGQDVPAHRTTTCEVMAEQSDQMVADWAAAGFAGVEMEAAYLFSHGERYGYPTAATLMACDELFVGGRTIHHKNFAASQTARNQARLAQYVAAVGELLELPYCE